LGAYVKLWVVLDDGVVLSFYSSRIDVTMRTCILLGWSSASLGMAMGRVWIGYGKYPPTTILAGITHTRPRLYPRVGFCTRARTHRVSGGYRIPAGIITLHTKKHMVDK
jgi:hypothetical protein